MGSTSTVSALDALLARHHVDLSSKEVLDELDSGFEAIPMASAAPLSMSEVQFLRAHAGSVAPVVDVWSGGDERQARARTAVHELAEALSGSVGIKDAAAILGIDRSRVSRRITGKALWAFDLHGSRRIPRWQFLGGEILPGLEVLVPAIPRGVTPGVVDVFMNTRDPDFDDRTPIEFLCAGGDPAFIAGFIEDLARW